MGVKNILLQKYCFLANAKTQNFESLYTGQNIVILHDTKFSEIL